MNLISERIEPHRSELNNRTKMQTIISFQLKWSALLDLYFFCLPVLIQDNAPIPEPQPVPLDCCDSTNNFDRLNLYMHYTRQWSAISLFPALYLSLTLPFSCLICSCSIVHSLLLDRSLPSLHSDKIRIIIPLKTNWRVTIVVGKKNVMFSHKNRIQANRNRKISKIFASWHFCSLRYESKWMG